MAKSKSKKKTSVKRNNLKLDKKLASFERKGEKRFGHYSFMVGIALAMITGFFVNDVVRSPFVGVVTATLVVLGIVVGILNVQTKETMGFLMASATLLLVGTANLAYIGWGIGYTLQAMLYFIRIFVAPAALIVALKTIKVLAED